MRTIPIGLLGGALLLAGCQKDPGVGGKAEIRGKVHVVEWDNNTGNPTGNEWYAAEARVYIVYGDHEFYDDDTRTGPDGLYKFSWLRKGDYTVFAYSECPTCESGSEVVQESVSIGDNKESVDVPTLETEVWN